MTLIDNFSFFAVCVNLHIKKIDSESLIRYCESIKTEVFAAVEASLDNTHHEKKKSSPEAAFVCPAHQDVECTTDLHVAHISDTNKLWICGEDPEISDSLSPDQTVWLGGPGS